jgi:hypothetical protein
MYRDEVFKLKQQRKFLHYNPRHGDRSIEHKRALDDIRSLIGTYGEHGAWLWDPYLSAYDILDTLVYCQYVGVDLRGMGSGKEHPENAGRRPAPPLGPYKDLWRCIKRIFREPAPPPPRDYIGEQRKILDNVASNWRGLKLEYRVRHGNPGWGFHDRFLIFPGHDRGALA